MAFNLIERGGYLTKTVSKKKEKRKVKLNCENF